MQNKKTVFLIIISIFLWVSFAFAYEDLPQPEFTKINFLAEPDIPEMNVDMAIVLTDSMAGLFLHPADVAILHVDVGIYEKDVFIFSDDGMNRLTIWMTQRNSANAERKIEAIKEYFATETGINVRHPRGLATTAANRKFNPESDVIYLADMGNNRVLELAYIPTTDGGKLVCNRIIGENELSCPTDVSLCIYNGETYTTDLYISEGGTFNDDGFISRYNINGACEGRWHDICFYESTNSAIELLRPISIACFPDTLEGYADIYVSDQYNNSLYFFTSKSSGDPFFTGVHDLDIVPPNWEVGGIGIDDYGRVYVANYMTGNIEILGPAMAQYFDPYGNGAIDLERFFLPHNIIFDTYYQQCEAIILECYARQSGIQSYIVGNGYSADKTTISLSRNILRPEIQLQASLPSGYKLGDAYPNPFNATCIIAFDLPEATNVRIDIYNVLGQLVSTIVNEYHEAGSHQVTFNGAGLASGMYLYKIKTDSFAEIKKAVLLK